jgi:hypothetical protein
MKVVSDTINQSLTDIVLPDDRNETRITFRST